MSEFSYLTDRLASQQIAERVASAERSRIPGVFMDWLAGRVADRIDG